MHISLHTFVRGTVRLTPQGELDVSTVAPLRESLLEVIQVDPPPQLVVIDLAGVSFLDFSSLSVLLQAQRELRRRGSDLCLVGARGAVAGVLAISGLSDVLDRSPGHAAHDGREPAAVRRHRDPTQDTRRRGCGERTAEEDWVRRRRVERRLDAARERQGEGPPVAPAWMSRVEALRMAHDLYMLGDLPEPPSLAWQEADVERALAAWQVRIDPAADQHRTAL